MNNSNENTSRTASSLTLGQAICKVAASYSGSVSSATVKSFRERGLDCKARGVYLKDVRPRVAEEKARQEALRRERKARRSTGDRLTSLTPAARLRTARHTLGQTELTKRQVRTSFSEQSKEKRYVVEAPGEPFGVLIVEPVEETEEDDSYYSKTWHRKHGPKVTVTGRYVRLCRIDIWTGSLEEVSRTDRYVEGGFRGNWLLDSAARLLSGRLPAGVSVSPRWQKARGKSGRSSSLRRVQLHKRCRAELVRSAGNVRVYRRTLAGVLVDHCAACVNERGTVQDTFHASAGPLAAVKGLRAKMRKDAEREAAEAAGELVTRKMLQEDLGFCRAGIRGAAQTLGVSPTEPITAERIAERAAKCSRRALSPFAPELRRLAKHVGREDLLPS